MTANCRKVFSWTRKRCVSLLWQVYHSLLPQICIMGLCRTIMWFIISHLKSWHWMWLDMHSYGLVLWISSSLCFVGGNLVFGVRSYLRHVICGSKKKPKSRSLASKASVRKKKKTLFLTSLITFSQLTGLCTSVFMCIKQYYS